jgi:hypothetical protein
MRLLALLLPFVLSCTTPQKECQPPSACLVFTYIPVDPVSGQTFPNLPPKTYIICDSEETASRLFKEAGMQAGQDI